MLRLLIPSVNHHHRKLKPSALQSTFKYGRKVPHGAFVAARCRGVIACTTGLFFHENSGSCFFGINQLIPRILDKRLVENLDRFRVAAIREGKLDIDAAARHMRGKQVEI